MSARRSVWPKIARHVEGTPAGELLAASGADRAVEFWVRYREWCDALIGGSRLPVLVLDPRDGWAHVADAVVDWLDAL